MELKEYLKIIKKNSKLIIKIGLVMAIAAFVFSIARPAEYETSLSLMIIKERTQRTDDFKYDGYYAFQAGEIIATSIEQWLKNPETVSAIYQEAGMEQNFKNMKSYTKKFTAKKMSSQYLEVKFKSGAKEEAEKISAAIVKIIGAKVEKMREASEEEISFYISGEKPVIIEAKPNAILNLIIGLISGLALGIFVVFGKRYFS